MAFTEKYVSSLAGGSGDGLSAGAAFTLTQMVTEINSVTGTGGQGKRYNIKADGTYTRSSGDDNMDSCTGSTTSPIYLRGYKTTIGDGYLGRSGTNGNGPLITTNMPTISYTSGAMFGGVMMVVESLNITGTSDGACIYQSHRDSTAVGCSFNNTSTASNNSAKVLKINEFCTIFECDILMSGTSGPSGQAVNIEQGGVRIDSCRIICSASTCNGITVEAFSTIYGCLIKGAGGAAGINITDSNRAPWIRNNTITGWQDGIYFNTSMNHPAFSCGNMITDNTRYGINYSTATCAGIVGIGRFRDNVTGNLNNSTQDWLQAGRIIPFVTTDTGGPETDYTNSASGDYSLIAASPAKGVNQPKISDMGAYGLADPVGGGAAVFNPLAQTIIRPAP